MYVQVQPRASVQCGSRCWQLQGVFALVPRVQVPSQRTDQQHSQTLHRLSSSVGDIHCSGLDQTTIFTQGIHTLLLSIAFTMLAWILVYTLVKAYYSHDVTFFLEINDIRRVLLFEDLFFCRISRLTVVCSVILRVHGTWNRDPSMRLGHHVLSTSGWVQ